MIVKLLTEHHLEFLSLKRGCRGSSESTDVKMPYCWKSHATAHYKRGVSMIHYIPLIQVVVQSMESCLSESHSAPSLLLYLNQDHHPER